MSLSVKNVNEKGQIMWGQNCDVTKKFVVVGDGMISKELKCKKWTSYDDIKDFVIDKKLMKKIKKEEKEPEIEVF